MNGFYATNTINMPYIDDASTNVRDWTRPLQGQVQGRSGVFSVYGYQVIDLFIAGRRQDRPEPDHGQLRQDPGQVHLAARHVRRRRDELHRPTKHLGSNRAKLCQIQGQKWVCLTDFMDH